MQISWLKAWLKTEGKKKKKEKEKKERKEKRGAEDMDWKHYFRCFFILIFYQQMNCLQWFCRNCQAAIAFLFFFFFLHPTPCTVHFFYYCLLFKEAIKSIKIKRSCKKNGQRLNRHSLQFLLPPFCKNTTTKQKL